MHLLEHDVWVMDQVTGFLGNDFVIHAADGQEIGRIRTGGSALGRMLMGSRELTVIDRDETPLLRLQDTMTLGRERMVMTDGTGGPLAQLVKRFSLFKTRFTVDFDGQPLDLTGSVWGFDFTMSGPRGQMATVARSWSGVTRALLGRSRYVVHLTPELAARERLVVLGTVIALDLVRAKEDRSSAG
ncbi:hypothetical protein SGUI_2072 [Serinicoccus hydrothermalis]|uniref:Scramblase n=1 Tax=Serinicoccus hydrothermalis TaxID=1758689 RepID=A0A1B1NDE6_9MICO|nr:phospholipid scramblase-related protein [Serinicoccus hydrothermalis]ANS79468.1 hypothetical protein SGUI_2072 [Serinicoccus hydrothermalis]